jgi:hypothetical protein
MLSGNRSNLQINLNGFNGEHDIALPYDREVSGERYQIFLGSHH